MVVARETIRSPVMFSMDARELLRQTRCAVVQKWSARQAASKRRTGIVSAMNWEEVPREKTVSTGPYRTLVR